MTELLLVVWRASEAVTSAIRRALITVGIEVQKSIGSNLIVAENITVSALITELWKTLQRAHTSANGLFFFFFQPMEVNLKISSFTFSSCLCQTTLCIFLTESSI
jgi:hypothetical protein